MWPNGASLFCCSRSRVLLEKAAGSPVVKKFSALEGTQEVYYCIYENPPPAPSLSQTNPIHTPIPLLEGIFWYFSFIFKCSHSLRLLHHKPVCTFPLPHMYYLPRLSHSSLFYHQNNIWLLIQIIKLLIM